MILFRDNDSNSYRITKRNFLKLKLDNLIVNIQTTEANILTDCPRSLYLTKLQ